MKLQPNLGNLDLIIRIGVGLVLVMLMAVDVIGAWGLVGLVLIVTGAARWCPAYALFGFSSRPKPHHAHHDTAVR